jgi:hypothetical protein
MLLFTGYYFYVFRPQFFAIFKELVVFFMCASYVPIYKVSVARNMCNIKYGY